MSNTSGMSDFARQQAEFQRGILDGDETVLAEILDSPREKRETLFGVYRYAYGSRLVDAMRNDHERLHLYLGDETFDEMGHASGANPAMAASSTTGASTASKASLRARSSAARSESTG